MLGAVRAPINTQDFSSFLLQAQASKAKVVGLANAGGDMQNAIKQASEFGLRGAARNWRLFCSTSPMRTVSAYRRRRE